MLVVHPKDRTTSVLSTLYDGMDANMVSSNCSNKKMEHLLHHVSTQERIMLLGHGSDKGLFSGMIIFEEQEAVEYGVMAQQEILKSTDDYVIHTDFCGEYYIAFYIEDKHGNRKVIAGYDYIDK